MNELLCRICTGFIWNKEKRKKFRNKHLCPSWRKQCKEELNLISGILKTLSTEVMDLRNTYSTNIVTLQNSLDYTAKIEELKNQMEKLDTTFSFLPEVFNRTMQTNLSTALLHQKTFLHFKNKHAGQDIVILATGPTAKKYKAIPNAIHIGVNRALDLGIDLDYIFIQDYSGATDYLRRINAYRPDRCIKFYGLTTEYEPEMKRVLPETDAILSSALRYRTDWMRISGFSPQFTYDISSQPLGCFGTVVFPALQFALWTNPKRIYLVGCDTSRTGYFDNEKKNFNYLVPEHLIPCYKKFKEFAHTYYPDVEIISINPVGLKGIFKDVFL